MNALANTQSEQTTSNEFIRVAITIGGVLGVFLSLLLPALGEGSGLEGVEVVELVLVLGLVLWGPFLLYYAAIRSRPGTFIVGLGLLLITAWAFWLAWTDDNSTAGANLMWIPFVNYPMVAAAWAAERFTQRTDELRRLRQRHEEEWFGQSPDAGDRGD